MTNLLEQVKAYAAEFLASCSLTKNSMYIFIDESGSFVYTKAGDSWNCVVAYMVPERERRYCERVVRKLTVSAGKGHHEEIKLRDLSEDQYIEFLNGLADHSGGY
jgi:hypothetical protein